MKYIQAYFRNEDEAEAAHASLHKLKTNNIVVDQIPEDDIRFGLFPIDFSQGVDPAGVENLNEDRSTGKFVLQFHVAEDEYEQAIRLLKDNGGMVER